MSSTKSIWSLIEEKDNEAVKLLLEGDPHLFHIVDSDTFTLLHCAAEHNNVEIVKYLLDKGFNVDANMRSGLTPLMIAVINRYGAIVRILLEAGADINVEDEGGYDVLYYAFKQYPTSHVLRPLFDLLSKTHSSKQLAKKVIKHGCQIDSAVYSRDPKMVEYMIKRGVPVKFSHVTDQFPLHAAVRLGNVEIVKVLLKYGADAEALDDDDSTPLHYLDSLYFENKFSDSCCKLESDKLEILKILLALGTPLTTCTVDGFFQVSPTLIQGSSKALSLILQSNIDFTAKDKCNEGTILHRIATNKNEGVIEVLKQHIEKFDVNAFDEWGYTPLHWAVKKGNVEMTKFLLAHGAETDSAIFCAYLCSKPHLENLHDQCAEILLQHDADPQTVRTTARNQEITIFDVSTEEINLNRMKLAIAQLAVREKQGIKITERICSKIDSNRDFKKYLNKCRRLLEKRISGYVSVFDVLAANDKKIVKYLNNEELIQKLIRMGHKKKSNTTYRYFHSTIKKRFSKGIEKKNLRNNAAGIICEISGDRLTPRHLVTEMVVDYLNDEDLRKLYTF